MKNSFILLFIFICFFYTSCKKKVITTIVGTVVNIGSRQPISNVKVIVNDGWASASASSSGSLDITYTDANGHFSITTEAGAPFLYLSKNGYRFVVQPYGDNTKYYAPGSNNMGQVLELWANAFLKAQFKGTNCLPTDSVYYYQGDHIPVAFTKTNYVEFGNGPFCTLDPEGWLEIGDTYTHYWIKYQINGIWHEKIDSVYIKSFTTYRDTIYF